VPGTLRQQHQVVTAQPLLTQSGALQALAVENQEHLGEFMAVVTDVTAQRMLVRIDRWQSGQEELVLRPGRGVPWAVHGDSVPPTGAVHGNPR